MRYWLTLAALLAGWLYVAQAVLVRTWATFPDVGWLLLVGVWFYVGTAVWSGFYATRPPRVPLFADSPGAVELPYETVRFASRDGTPLEGWWVPSQNKRGVILLHGFGENRLGMVPIAKILVEHGFGVLLFDLRAHGRDVSPFCAWGWLETADVQGAVDYVLQQTGVERLGLYGFSLGGQIAVRTAAQEPRVRAVVADGAIPAVLRDHTFGNRFQMLRQWVWLWLVYTTQGLLLGLRPPRGVAAMIHQLHPRPLLLISTGRRDERNNNREFAKRAGEKAMLWELPLLRHGSAVEASPDLYKQKLWATFEKM